MTQPQQTAPASSAAQLAQILALIAAQAAIREQLSQTAARAVQLAFAAVTNFWDVAQVLAAITAATRAVGASQRRMASVTDAYLARSTSLVTGDLIRPVGAIDIRQLRRQLPQSVIEALAHARTSAQGQGPALTAAAKETIRRAQEDGQVSAVPASDVYGRLADNYRYLVSSGKNTPDEAMKKILQRAATLADTDVALADRAQVTSFFSQRRGKALRGYRRVLHPELGSGNPPCGLCVIAADNVYSFEELMPIHGRCRCTVVAVGAEDDPGFELNRQDMQRIYEAAGGTDAQRLKTIRVEVTEHGELGPILTYAQQRFRGPREVAKTQTNDLELKRFAELEGHQDELERLLDRRNAGEPGLDAQIRFHQTKATQLDRSLAA